MFDIILLAAATPMIAKQVNDPDCRPQMILTSGASAPREQGNQPSPQRPRAKPQQPGRGIRPCVILASV